MRSRSTDAGLNGALCAHWVEGGRRASSRRLQEKAMRWVAMVSYGAYKRRAATYRTSISISVARSGHLARQSPVKRRPLRSPAREQRRRGCSSAPSTRRRRPEADQYGNLTDIDRVERDE